MLPGLAEQLDAETQREQARFRGLLGLCLLGLLLWLPVCFRIWTSRPSMHSEHVLKKTFSLLVNESQLPTTATAQAVNASPNETERIW